MGNQIIPLLMHPDDLTEYIENIIPLYAKTRDNEHISHQYRMKDNTGIWHWIESTEIIYKRKDGIPQQIFGAARDVTERKKAEEIICQQNRELQELNATKDKFFSIIAHDLRSPFSSLLGFSDLLLKNPDEYNKEGIIRIVNQINNISDQTFKLLENLLNWSKLQTGAMIPQPKECNFKDLVYDVFQLNTEIAKGKNITLRNLVGNIIVNCDPEMTKTILRNLISNALKFTNNNGVVSIEATQRDSFVEIQISDTGVGIPSELIAHLFRIDTTFSTIGTANELGTGLGLHLCKELIEKQGGKIWVKSEIGKGSEFHITIPITH
jgi:signal transduction histidine kinase